MKPKIHGVESQVHRPRRRKGMYIGREYVFLGRKSRNRRKPVRCKFLGVSPPSRPGKRFGYVITRGVLTPLGVFV